MATHEELKAFTEAEFRSYIEGCMLGLQKKIAELEARIARLEKNAKQKGRAGWYAGKSGR
jgi:hypothetical protein